MTLQELAQIFKSYRDKGKKIPAEVWPQAIEHTKNLPYRMVAKELGVHPTYLSLRMCALGIYAKRKMKKQKYHPL